MTDAVSRLASSVVIMGDDVLLVYEVLPYTPGTNYLFVDRVPWDWLISTWRPTWAGSTGAFKLHTINVLRHRQMVTVQLSGTAVLAQLGMHVTGDIVRLAPGVQSWAQAGSSDCRRSGADGWHDQLLADRRPA